MRAVTHTGEDRDPFAPAPRHAKLAVNAGFAVAGFPIDTHVEKSAQAQTHAS